MKNIPSFNEFVNESREIDRYSLTGEYMNDMKKDPAGQFVLYKDAGKPKNVTRMVPIGNGRMKEIPNGDWMSYNDINEAYSTKWPYTLASIQDEVRNESKINEANDLQTLDALIKIDSDGKEGYEEIAKILGAKPSDILVYDADENGDSKEYKTFDKAFMTKGGDFKDAKAPEYSDYYMANVAYNKKLNVVSSYAGGYLSFFATK